MHTAQHLVKRALSGDIVRNRTIILVTHHITLCLPIASYLVELSSGSVLRHGSTQDLHDKGQLEKLVEAEDIVLPDEAQSSGSEIENEADAPDQIEEDSPKPKPSDGKLIEAEARAEGRISTNTYLTYIRAAGLYSWFLTVALMILIRMITIGNQVRHFVTEAYCVTEKHMT